MKNKLTFGKKNMINLKKKRYNQKNSLLKINYLFRIQNKIIKVKFNLQSKKFKKLNKIVKKKKKLSIYFKIILRIKIIL